MINKGNILFIFLVYLAVVAQIVGLIHVQLRNNTMTMDNMVMVNKIFSKDIIIVEWLKGKLLDEEFSSGDYNVMGVTLEVDIREDTIYIYLVEIMETMEFEIKDKVIYDYNYIN